MKGKNRKIILEEFRIVELCPRRVLLTTESPVYFDLINPVISQVWVKPHYTFLVPYFSVNEYFLEIYSVHHLIFSRPLLHFGSLLIDPHLISCDIYVDDKKSDTSRWAPWRLE